MIRYLIAWEAVLIWCALRSFAVHRPFLGLVFIAACSAWSGLVVLYLFAAFIADTLQDHDDDR